MDEHLSVVLGALLHDVGKVAQRASPGASHLDAGIDMLKDSMPLPANLSDAVANIIRHHHDPADTLSGIVRKADLLALNGKEHREDGLSRTDLARPLYSLFNRIQLPNKPPPAEKFVFRPEPIGEPNFPISPTELKPEDYGRLKNGFLQFISESESPTDIVQLYLNAAEKFFSMIPSEVDEAEPDVSLFDHLKITAAIASCLYKFANGERVPNEDEPAFLLVGGDISGIQSFIYSVSYQAALKGLRARSFYIEILMEHFASSILKKLGLHRTNLIYIGGGSFYMLLPNTDEVKDLIIERRKAFNRWLFAEHEARLFLAVDWIELNGHSFTASSSGEKPSAEKKDEPPTLPEAWTALFRKLSVQKEHRFHDLIGTAMFEPQDMGNRKVCDVCGKVFPAEERMEVEDKRTPGTTRILCPTCYDFERIANELIKARHLAASPPHEGTGLSMKVEHGKEYALFYYPLSKPGVQAVYTINGYEGDRIPLFLGNYPNKPLEFGGVAKAAYGASYLATLRADVDNLGATFQQGIPEKHRTFARIATLSRLMTLFFKHYINHIAAGRWTEKFNLTPDHPRQMVIVYSGGDDLFVTGAWSDVVEFAFDIQKAFSKFTGGNPSITISGGIVITGPKYPIFRMAKLAGDAEEKSKGNEGKNSLTLFNITRSWDEWHRSIDEVLRPLIRMGEFREDSRRFVPSFSSSLIYKLLALHKEAFGDESLSERGARGRKSPQLVIPIVAYVLARSKPRSDEHAEAWLKFAGKAVSPDIGESLRWFKGLKAPLQWLALLIRGGEEE